VIKLLLLASLAFGQAGFETVGQFSGLNDTDSPGTLTTQAQDALNVETNLAGTAIIKRKGFSRLASLTYSTAPVTGSHSFIDLNGNRQDIVCQDRYCFKSTNQGTFQVFLSTAGGSGNVPTRWSFVDIGGYLYGANDSRDPIMEYDGTTRRSPATMPAGSILELTTDRLAVTDTTADPNTVYYSQKGLYTNFTTGLDSEDPYTDVIGTPGERNTGLKHSQGVLYIFKQTSITSCILGDQYSSRCSPISNTIGTNDPASIIETPQGIFFRGQDRGYWRLDDSGLTLISREISNLVQSQTAGSQQSNTQTSQSDWSAATQNPSGSWDYTTNSGSVFSTTFTFVDTSSNDFAAGTLSNVSVTDNIGGISLSSVTWRDDFDDGSFAVGQVTWTTTGWSMGSGQMATNATVNAATATQITISSGSWQVEYKFQQGGTPILDFCNGSGALCVDFRFISKGNGDFYSLRLKGTGSNSTQGLQLVKNVSGTETVLAAAPVTQADNSWKTYQVTRVGDAIHAYQSDVFISSATDSAISGGQTFLNIVGNQDFSSQFIRGLSVYRYNSPGRFVSRTFTSAFNSPVWGTLSSTMTVSPETNIAFYTEVSNDGSAWDSLVTTSDTLKIGSASKKYIRYTADLTSTSSTKTPVGLAFGLLGAATGQLTTQCISPGSAVTSWGIVSCAFTATGNPTIGIEIATGTSCGTLTNPYVSLTNNQTITVDTAAAMNLRFSSLMTSATEQTQIDSCSVYWNNGAPAPPVWGVFDSIRNAVYWASSINNSTTNNRFLKYDLAQKQWFPFDLAVTAPKRIGTALYFGSSTGGYWNLYGGVDNDNGSAINAYWKSRDFSGSDPFVEKNLNRISVVVRNQGSGTLTTTYTTSDNRSGSYSINQSTTSGVAYVRANYALPLLSPFQFFNVKFGNNSGSPFEVNGFRLDWFAQPWKANTTP